MTRESRDENAYCIKEEQLAELRRRRAEKDPKKLTLAVFDERLRRFEA